MTTAFEGFGERVNQAMTNAGLSRTDVSNKLEIHHSWIGKVIDGTIKRPAEKNVIALAEMFDVSEAWLVYGTQLDKLTPAANPASNQVFVVGDIMGKDVFQSLDSTQNFQPYMIPVAPITGYQDIEQNSFRVQNSAHPDYQKDCFVTVINPDEAHKTGQGAAVGDDLVIEMKTGNLISRDLYTVLEVHPGGRLIVDSGGESRLELDKALATVRGIVLAVTFLAARTSRKLTNG